MLGDELVIVHLRSGQLALSHRAQRFVDAAEFGSGVIVQIRPDPEVSEVIVDPLRQFGAPVVRSVPTDVIAEQIRAGDNFASVAEFYDLDQSLVEAAVRYELRRTPDAIADAA